ncbi:OmpA family protein [Microvirga sp. STR05]|uniref:OmpA family protein n=1 Tax=Hymenobacter duratus TaxID=2771356 RepID=A0ABR8JJ14_9BACT|nr:OmpA family protein [Hymenobacter duratus]MBD2716872.1 OmpA family protein [Hymenobacter duratus]MBR7951788.1 OmpA family protein [Microvirga sp. STR05]
MKPRFWLILVALLASFTTSAQSLSGVWQGVETDTGEPGEVWPAVMRLQKSNGTTLFGVLYQEQGGQQNMTVTFQMQGTRTATGMRLEHVRKLHETGATPFTYWCEGSITFTYDPTQEKLTGRATYQPTGNCDVGTFTLYRVKLKSAATVAANTESTIRVSGRNVLWYADAALKQPVATGNTYRTRLSKTTTFYLTQGYYPTRQSTAVPITIQVTSAPPKPALPAAIRPDTSARQDTARRVPTPLVAASPVVLPTVLFRLGTAELLPEGLPALERLAAELKSRPTLRLRIAGHTDKIGEPQKNQVLSEQRAEAVKTYLVKAGIEAVRISTIGYGDSRPLYSSPDARNRRVEVAEARE